MFIKSVSGSKFLVKLKGFNVASKEGKVHFVKSFFFFSKKMLNASFFVQNKCKVADKLSEFIIEIGPDPT